MRAGAWRVRSRDRYHLAEGARWHEDALIFVDLLRGVLYQDDAPPGDRPRRLLSLGVPLGAVAPVAGRPGEWIAAAGAGIALVGPGEPLRWLSRPEERAPVRMRMNDAACDPQGRFWAGSMEVTGARGAGSLYRVDHDGGVQCVLSGLTVPNGPAFTPCGTVMYLADSARRVIHRFPVEPASGELGPGEVFARFSADEGRPDGMTVDDEGHLWVALWGGAQVRRYAPRGSPVLLEKLPTRQPTSVALGGGCVFVTTARHRMDPPDPLAGAVLVRPCAMTAPPAYAFGPEGGGRGISLP
ncbi:SMP-30/gluconolactonase/LRE family protein [Streptomyces sp. NPDC001922]|uniref:SMP-30/gluconolactonase/LRE family protein n=1 Tax=Streptomyces sp. NPDC001922 TaxID=3364624 RepID=UPI0036B49FE1